MKKIYKPILSLLAICFLLASCDDFLDRPPFDSMSDDQFWKKEEHARIFSYGFYTALFPGYGTGVSHGPFLLGQTFNDDYTFNSQTEFTPINIPATDGGWSFVNVRKANYMLERVSDLKGVVDESTLNHWTGIGRFFRAALYSNLSFTYGDVPYLDRVPKYSVQSPVQEEKDFLYKDRDPRTFVAEKNIEDFRYAIENVRKNDGELQINKYVVAAYASRVMLREGTFLKYHNIDQAVAKKCLEFAKEASEVVMSGPYSISDSYNGLFASDDLTGNNEVIIYRKYLDGILMHSTLAYSNTDPQAGSTKSLMESYLRSDGLPLYYNNPSWKAATAADFFKDRDPRLTANFRSKYYVRGENTSPFAYSLSGYSWRKFMDDNFAGSTEQKFTREKNVTDAPCLRLGEVLLNYAEACYELGVLEQQDLDKSINLLRARKGIEIPALEIIGGNPAVKGVVYDDPKRDPDVPSLLWEIRRERRTELCFEGLRLNDLKRWKKLDYLYNGVNPDIRYGAYIRLADYPNANKDEVQFDTPGATEGYILTNRGTQRSAPVARNYVNPIPTNQIQDYKANGYTLTQTKEWQD